MKNLPHIKTRDFDEMDAENDGVYLGLLRRAPIWRRAAQLEGLIEAHRMLILSDLRRRYPQASADELRRRLAARLLPREDVIRVFGWDAEREGY